MFKNTVFKPNVDTKQWIKSALIRAIKTFAQVAVSLLTVGQTVMEVNWLNVLSVSTTAAIMSILTSIAGLPEVMEDDGEDLD